jgi:biopolymer transport protein ExbB/TolQ
MGIDLAIATTLVLATAFLSTSILYYLLTKDFFLPQFLEIAKRLTAPEFLVAGGAMASLVLVLVAVLYNGTAKLHAVSNVEASLDLMRLWTSISIPTKAVVLILFVMSACAVGLMVDRALAYHADRELSRRLREQVATALTEGNIDKAIAIVWRNKNSHITEPVAAVLSEFMSASTGVRKQDAKKAIEAARFQLQLSLMRKHAQTEHRLSMLASLGSTAFFVGLFGGFIGLAYEIAKTHLREAVTVTSLRGIIAGFSLTTVLGVFVAFAAVWAYVYLGDLLGTLRKEADNISREVVEDIIAFRARTE